MLLSRCGMEPEQYFSSEDFTSISDFNTPESIAVLGTAVSEISERVLRQIEAAVKAQERSQTHDIQPERRLDEIMPEMMRAAGATEELKADDSLKWTGLMNSLKAQAEEMILNELVYN